MGIADIGTNMHPRDDHKHQTSYPTDLTYQNFYYTQVGGRGDVFIQDQSGVAVPNNVVAASDIQTLYSNVAADGTEKGIANNFSITTNVTIEQFPPQRLNNQVCWSGLGLPYSGQNKVAPNAVVNNLGPDMLASVQAGTATHPASGYIDAGYAFTGGITSNTTVMV